MKLIEEVYHDSYQPKLRIDNYAYYVDDTNRDIVYRIVRQYLNQLPNINVEEHLYPHHITGEFANELTQHDFYVDGRHVRICANNDQIIVTDSDSSIVKTGAMAPYEFVQLVKSHVKPDIITMLEQYVQMT